MQHANFWLLVEKEYQILPVIQSHAQHFFTRKRIRSSQILSVSLSNLEKGLRIGDTSFLVLCASRQIKIGWSSLHSTLIPSSLPCFPSDGSPSRRKRFRSPDGLVEELRTEQIIVLATQKKGGILLPLSIQQQTGTYSSSNILFTWSQKHAFPRNQKLGNTSKVSKKRGTIVDKTRSLIEQY